MSRALAAAWHCIAGLLWLAVLAVVARVLGGPTIAALWAVCAGLLWLAVLGRIAGARDESPWTVSFLWWLSSFVAPAALAGYVLGHLKEARQPAAAAPRPIDESTEVEMNVDGFLLRLDDVEQRLRSLQRDVSQLRAEAQAARPPERDARQRRQAPPASPPAPARMPAAAPRPAAPSPPAPRRPRREIALADLLGAKALALAGGVVTLLGVVFFFVLAVNRGWIGPGARVALGAGASTLVLTAGLWLRRKFGETYSALAAAGAGIAGGYATLLAATALYDLVSKPLALVAAAGVAAVGTAVALAWEAEIVAALGLVGAMFVPALVAIQGGLSAVGTGFVAIVFAAAAVVGLRGRWPGLLLAATAASAPQIAVQTAQAGNLDWGVAALAAVFALLYLGTGIVRQLRAGDAPLERLTTTLVLAGAGVAWLAADRLFGVHAGGVAAGLALLSAAGAYGLAAALLYRGRGHRELSTLVGAVALTLAGVGVADALSGSTVTYTWAAEAALLAFLASRLREPRLQLGALAYLLLAAGHAVGFEASPEHFFVALRHPASGAPALAAVALAGLLYAGFVRPWEGGSPERGVLRLLAPVIASLGRHRRLVTGTVVAGALATGAYALSLAVLELFQAAWPDGGIQAAFERGHVGVTGLWSLAGLAAVALGLSGRTRVVVVGGFTWLGVTLLNTLAFDASHLAPTPRSLAFLALAGGLFLAGYCAELANDERPDPVSAFALVAALLLAVASAGPLLGVRWGSVDAYGAALLGVALVAAAFAAPVLHRRRDLSSLLWGAALVLAAVAEARLVGGVWLVLAWAATAAVLAWLAAAVREERFQAASLAYLVLGVGATLILEAPPRDLVVAAAHPGAGVPSVLLVSAATAVFAALAGSGAIRERLRRYGAWSAVVLAVYAASLTILEAAERLSPESLETDFQRGHTAVSALWGGLGLALLYAGLTRGRGALRLGGFALFGVSLGKLFLYDLAQLSSVTRALSFLAVGGVLLLGGFFYQRLSSQLDERRDAPARKPSADGLRS
jgi:uncharacterized membrane protein